MQQLEQTVLIANGQILAYKDNCNKLATGTAMTNGDGTYSIYKSYRRTASELWVKYDVKSIVEQRIPDHSHARPLRGEVRNYHAGAVIAVLLQPVHIYELFSCLMQRLLPTMMS
jgi:hypothetical protein